MYHIYSSAQCNKTRQPYAILSGAQTQDRDNNVVLNRGRKTTQGVAIAVAMAIFFTLPDDLPPLLRGCSSLFTA